MYASAYVNPLPYSDSDTETISNGMGAASHMSCMTCRGSEKGKPEVMTPGYFASPSAPRNTSVSRMERDNAHVAPGIAGSAVKGCTPPGQ